MLQRTVVSGLSIVSASRLQCLHGQGKLDPSSAEERGPLLSSGAPGSLGFSYSNNFCLYCTLFWAGSSYNRSKFGFKQLLGHTRSTNQAPTLQEDFLGFAWSEVWEPVHRSLCAWLFLKSFGPQTELEPGKGVLYLGSSSACTLSKIVRPRRAADVIRFWCLGMVTYPLL